MPPYNDFFYVKEVLNANLKARTLPKHLDEMTRVVLQLVNKEVADTLLVYNKSYMDNLIVKIMNEVDWSYLWKK